jgi:hypothetical protein
LGDESWGGCLLSASGEEGKDEKGRGEEFGFHGNLLL